jgi:hypothetical protein
MAAYTKQQKAEALEAFEQFLFYMDDVVEAFVEQAAKHGFDLDYSLASLDLVETFALNIEAKPETKFADHASQYMGTVLVDNYDGHWELSLDSKNNSLNYGLPVITGHTEVEGLQFCPYQTINLFLAKPKRGMLKDAVLADVADDDFNLDEFADED